MSNLTLVLRAYRVEQISLNGGALTDFDLPRTIGYYASERAAELGIMEHMQAQSTKTSDDLTTSDDYRTESIEIMGCSGPDALPRPVCPICCARHPVATDPDTGRVICRG